MFKRIIVLIVLTSLLNILQSCASIIGYSIGNKIDNKSMYPESVIIPKEENDSTKVDSSNINSSNDTLKPKKTYYRFLGLGIGISLDFMILLVVMMSANPIKPGIRF